MKFSGFLISWTIPAVSWPSEAMCFSAMSSGPDLLDLAFGRLGGPALGRVQHNPLPRAVGLARQDVAVEAPRGAGQGEIASFEAPGFGLVTVARQGQLPAW